MLEDFIYEIITTVAVQFVCCTTLSHMRVVKLNL